ncbi:MAG: triosephosphate isomerase [Candidatus Hepatoplasma vulgare]|nr:MAG: triosephosphate isomerase [Candidatus Hepatoplasma sp.]
MNKKLIIGNWKMNMNESDSYTFFDEIKKNNNHFVHEFAIIPPAPLIISIKKYLKKNNINNWVKIGIQNFYPKDKGAFTGEISIKMFEDNTLDYLLVGHSERRLFFNENNQFAIEKALYALKNSNAKIVFIFGETLEQRKKGNLENIIKEFLEKLISEITFEDLERFIFAYEPIWSIGTGKIPTIKEIEEIFLIIKEILKSKFKGKDVNISKLIYGGSVNEVNYKLFLNSNLIDGLLIGGVALESHKFISILKNE